MSKLFYISSMHSVYQDSFTEGESVLRNEFHENKVIRAESSIEALKQYYDKVIYKPFRQDTLEMDEDTVYDSFLVDENGDLASEFEMNMWENNERVLWSENLSTKIYEMQPVIFP